MGVEWGHVYHEGSCVGGGIERDSAGIDSRKLHVVKRQCGIPVQWNCPGICEN